MTAPSRRTYRVAGTKWVTAAFGRCSTRVPGQRRCRDGLIRYQTPPPRFAEIHVLGYFIGVYR